MKHMARNKNFFKRRYKRIEQFFTHLPLFAKYLTIMTAMILVSYFVLASALTVFLSTRVSSEKEILLTENVKQNAQYCEKIFANCITQEDINNSLIIVCNNLGVTSNAIDADVFFCNTDGRVVLCKEDFLYNYSPDSDGCMLHKGYIIPNDIMASVTKGYFFSSSKVQGLYSERTFLAGAPVRVGGTVIGAVFAATPLESSFREYATRIMSLFLSSAIFAAALSFLVVYAFTAKLTRPLRQMSNATKAYAQGDFSKRVVVRGSDEFAELCQNFNRMASALSVLESSRRSFVANISHELKTPMTTIGGFIDGKILDSAIIGLLCYIGCTIFKFPNALLISAFVGITNVIPYFGPFIGAIPSVFLILIEDPVKAIWFGIFILGLQQLDGNIIGPAILGDRTGLSSFWVLFAIILFGELWGIAGMVVCVPLFAVIYDIVKKLVRRGLNKKNQIEIWEQYKADYPDEIQG